MRSRCNHLEHLAFEYDFCTDTAIDIVRMHACLGFHRAGTRGSSGDATCPHVSAQNAIEETAATSSGERVNLTYRFPVKPDRYDYRADTEISAPQELDRA